MWNDPNLLTYDFFFEPVALFPQISCNCRVGWGYDPDRLGSCLIWLVLSSTTVDWQFLWLG